MPKALHLELSFAATLSLKTNHDLQAADMAEKRKRDIESGSGDHDSGKKKMKRGFVVGPDNLADGIYKRKSMPKNELRGYR